ncbi:MAG: LL-diaminopimelate aminotransferase [Elusimicrobia bacterium]|jgi:LL-diaminopimelate aminotransferase|nr:LL-diaminopimelate aminotransferase [Elusimicrobiota bacterium]
MVEFADRIKALPPYLFIEVDRMKQKALDEGVDIINLGVGDPDIPTPERIRAAMKKAIDNPENHRYPMGKGKELFRAEIKKFMKKRFGLDMNLKTMIHPLIGSKEGIAHFPLAFVNPGDLTLVTEPSYPVYNSGTIFSGGTPHFVPLKEENNFLPDWKALPEKIKEKAVMLYINYPNNPTGATATKEFFAETVEMAKKYNIIVLHDAAYSEMYYKEPPVSFLNIDGAMDVGIELHSLSKTFSMTGWRIGWACGNEKLIEGLEKVKDNIDSGVFGAIQEAAVVALKNYDELVPPAVEIYRKRLEIMAGGLKELGWQVKEPEATFYLWTKPPADISSIDAVKKIIKEAGIICTPGSGFGDSGEGYVRFALTRDIERIKEAIARLRGLKWQSR